MGTQIFTSNWRHHWCILHPWRFVWHHLDVFWDDWRLLVYFNSANTDSGLCAFLGKCLGYKLRRNWVKMVVCRTIRSYLFTVCSYHYWNCFAVHFLHKGKQSNINKRIFCLINSFLVWCLWIEQVLYFIQPHSLCDCQHYIYFTRCPRQTASFWSTPICICLIVCYLLDLVCCFQPTRWVRHEVFWCEILIKINFFRRKLQPWYAWNCWWQIQKFYDFWQGEYHWSHYLDVLCFIFILEVC